MHFVRGSSETLGVKESCLSLQVKIIRMTDEAFPGFVECKFVDAFGQEHTIVEKAPVVSRENVSARSSFHWSDASRAK